jgi:hypothetical protein
MSTSTRARAEAAATERLASLKGTTIFRTTPPGYTERHEQNLILGVTNQDFWDDLKGGDGAELDPTSGGPAKFCAAYSSSALTVNTFAPFRHAPSRLKLAGYGNFRTARFEKKCPTGLPGKAPNLDFFASGLEANVGVESKFLETLTPKMVKFSARYALAIEQEAEPTWRAMYQRLLAHPTRFNHLDAAQLVKHYLGLRHSLRGREGPQVLVYLFWEPRNAEEIPEFREHRGEVARFSEEVKGSEVRFVALSYPQLWEIWATLSGWVGIFAHVEALRQRYDFVI